MKHRVQISEAAFPAELVHIRKDGATVEPLDTRSTPLLGLEVELQANDGSTVVLEVNTWAAIKWNTAQWVEQKFELLPGMNTLYLSLPPMSKTGISFSVSSKSSDTATVLIHCVRSEE